MNSLLEKTKAKNLTLDEAQIEGLFYLLLENTLGFAKDPKNFDVSNSSLVRKTGLPKETLRQFKASISNHLVDTEADQLLLSKTSLDEVRDMQPKAYPWTLLELENNTLLNVIKKIRAEYEIKSKRQYDQFFATAESTVAKAEIILKRHNLENKSIALLGDDDLVSVALALSGNEYREIVVYDLDRELLSTIDKIAKEKNLKNITTVYYDARNDLKPSDINRFDIVLTDPPYTRYGISLFLNRAVNLLKDAKNDAFYYVYLNYGNSFKEPEKELKVQEIILKSNLLIENKIDKFTRYLGAESIGSASSLYILKKNKHTVLTDNYVDAEIYTFEKTFEENFPYVDHFVFKLYKVPTSLLSSKKALQKACGDFCKWHRLKVVDMKLTRFKGGGFTLTYVLSQSNLVIHTWPESSALHIDLITCSPIAKKESFAANLAQLFQTNYIEINSVE